MHRLFIVLTATIAMAASATPARAGFVDISYEFGGSTVVITSPINFTITGVSGSAVVRFSEANASGHPLASANVYQLSFMLNVPVNALGGALMGTVMQVITTGGFGAYGHFNGMTIFPPASATQTHSLTGYLHCTATFHFMNSYAYMQPAGVLLCTMTVGLPVSQISMQYGITGTTQIPTPTFEIQGTGSSLGNGFYATTPVKQQLGMLPPSLGTAYLVGTETMRSTETPEPSTVWSFGIAIASIAGLGVVRSSRKRRP